MPVLIGPAIEPGTMAELPQPDIDLGEILLRPWRPSDRPAVVAAYSEPSIQRWHVRSMTDDEAGDWIDAWRDRWMEERGAGWAIVDSSGLLGQISLRRLNLFESLAELSYWVVPAARGRGLATQALAGLTAWSFERLGLNRVELKHSTRNPISCRVANKVGFVLEGTLRAWARHVDGWHDMHIHGRLATDRFP